MIIAIIMLCPRLYYYTYKSIQYGCHNDYGVVLMSLLLSVMTIIGSSLRSLFFTTLINYFKVQFESIPVPICTGMVCIISNFLSFFIWFIIVHARQCYIIFLQGKVSIGGQQHELGQ